MTRNPLWMLLLLTLCAAGPVLQVVPQPREVTAGEGAFDAKSAKVIAVTDDPADRFTATI